MRRTISRIKTLKADQLRVAMIASNLRVPEHRPMRYPPGAPGTRGRSHRLRECAAGARRQAHRRQSRGSSADWRPVGSSSGRADTTGLVVDLGHLVLQRLATFDNLLSLGADLLPLLVVYLPIFDAIPRTTALISS
jgi:hypothetical protein